jgi:hypothetical protein
VAAPHEPNIAVAGGEETSSDAPARGKPSDRTPSDRTPSDRTPSDRTPSGGTSADRTPGGTLRRLLSRDNNPLFGTRPNGTLAPPLSIPVDPLLAGPPMEATRLEEEVSANGLGGHDRGGSIGVVDDDDDRLELADPVAADVARAVIDAEDLLAADDVSFDRPAGGVDTSDLEPLLYEDQRWRARTAPHPSILPPPTEAVEILDPPATVSVPALVPLVEAPEMPAGAPQARSTVPPPPRRRRTRPRVRKVTRIVRYVDAWSVFKVALLINAVLATVMVTASVLLWNLAYSTDVIDNVEGVIEDWLAYETFAFDGQAMFRAVLILGGLFVIGATGLAVLAATLFNLISDLTGGVKVTVLEREVLTPSPSKTPKRRGGAARRAAAGFPTPGRPG